MSSLLRRLATLSVTCGLLGCLSAPEPLPTISDSEAGTTSGGEADSSDSGGEADSSEPTDTQANTTETDSEETIEDVDPPDPTLYVSVELEAPNGPAGPFTCAVTDKEPNALLGGTYWSLNGTDAVEGEATWSTAIEDCDVLSCYVVVSAGDTQKPADPAFYQAPFGNDCDDNNLCTEDGCKGTDSGGCDHPALDCDDGNICTVDTCEPATGCVHEAVVQASGGASTDYPCDDGDPCTTDDICGVSADDGGGICVPGAPLDCPPTETACHVDTCSAQEDGTAKCIALPVAAGTPCDDGNACLEDDTCFNEGALNDCEGWPPVPLCEDGDPCTGTECDEELGCTFPPAAGACNDGDPCTANDQCDYLGDGTCQGGELIECPQEAPPCKVYACVEGESGCSLFNAPLGSDCDDELFCTVGETCDGDGNCGGGSPETCASLSGSCVAAVCDESADACTTSNAPNGSYCDDDDLCTLLDACEEGACVGSQPGCGQEFLVYGEGKGQFALGDRGNGRYAVQWHLPDVNSSLTATRVAYVDQYGSPHLPRVTINQTGKANTIGLLRAPDDTLLLLSGLGSTGLSPGNCTQYFYSYSTAQARFLDKHESTTPVNLMSFQGGTGDACNFQSEVSGIKAYLQDFRAIPIPFADGSYAFLGTATTTKIGPLLNWVPNPPPGTLRWSHHNETLELLSDNPINLPNLVGSPESFDAVALPQQPEQALVVWAAAGNLQAQRFSPSGVPAEEAWEVANIAAGTVRVANLPNQGTVIAWDAPDADGNGVWVQRLDSGDIPLESAFVAHGSQTGNQRLSDLAVFSDGGFVLLFTDDFGDGDGTCAKAQLFAPSGFPLNTDLVLNTTPEGDQEARSVLVLDTDEWVATFATTEDFSGHPAYTRRFFQSGEPSMGQPEIRGSAQVTGNQSAPAAARSGERVLLVYTSPHENDPDGGILGRVFTPDGHQVRAEALINSQTAGALSEPSVAGGPDRFLITWTAAEAEGEDGDVVGTWLNAEGTPLGVGDIPIGTVTAGHQGQSAVAVTANGNYLVLFEGDSGNVDAATDILARAFDADGVSESIETVIHSVTAGIQTAPSVVADNDTFLAVYQSQDAAGTGTDTGEDILLQRLTLSGVPSGDPVIVNNASSGDQTRPTISVSDDGTQITVCWLTVEAGVTMRELHCRHLNEDLQGFGSFPVSSPTVPAGTLVTPWPVHPTLARLDDGTLLLGWAEQSHASQQDIAVAVLTENKAPQTRIVANRTRPQNQDHPFLLATGGSTFWAGWESPGQDGDGSGVYFRTLPKPPLAP